MNDQELTYIKYVPLLQRLFGISLVFELDKVREIFEQAFQDLCSKKDRLHKIWAIFIFSRST